MNDGLLYLEIFGNRLKGNWKSPSSYTNIICWA